MSTTISLLAVATGPSIPNASPAPAAGREGDATTTAQFATALAVLVGLSGQPAPGHGSPASPGGSDAGASGGSASHPEGAESPATAAAGVTADAHAPSADESATTSSPAGTHGPPRPVADTDAAALAAAALTGAAAPFPASGSRDANAPDTSRVTRGLDRLAPEFRERLERLIDRMESEYGYKIEVRETYRSQARQDALFAQGRTVDGPVVTWTQSSNHTVGRAADLVIHGSSGDTLAYDRLLRVAREEGLRTLGARDPGHVELPTTVVARAASVIASPSSIDARSRELQSPASPPTAAAPAVATVARVAPVAPVATVATVAVAAAVGAQPARASRTPTTRAHTARGADVHQSGTGGGSPTPVASQQRGIVAPAPAVAAGMRQTSADAGAHADRSDAEPNDPRAHRARAVASAAREAAELLRDARDAMVHPVAGPDPASPTSAPASDARAGAVGATDMSERIARLLKVQEAAHDRPVSQVLLRLERPDGGEDRVRVDLRGSTVSATLDVGDAAAAESLGANVKELQRALERHGLDTDALTVRASPRAVESQTLARAAGALVESDLTRAAASSGSNGFTNTSSRDRGARQDDQRPSPDSQRHRSRREQKGDPR